MRVMLFGLTLSAGALAADDPRETADPSRWLERALQTGQTEIVLATLAHERSHSASVKTFASRLLADHRRANAELLALAKERGLTVSEGVNPQDRQLVEMLRAMKADAFDASYAEHMVTGHAQAIDLFTQATQGTDRALAELAARQLSVLKEHKRMADELNRQMGGAVRSSSSSERARP